MTETQTAAKPSGYSTPTGKKQIAVRFLPADYEKIADAAFRSGRKVSEQIAYYTLRGMKLDR